MAFRKCARRASGLAFLVAIVPVLATVAAMSVLPGPVAAQAGGGLRALSTGDDSKGWEAVGRLNLGSRGFCTGALIDTDLVLTAAHCLFDKVTGKRMDTGDITFLAGWRNGRAAAYRGVRRAVPHPAYVYSATMQAARVAHDLALVQLDQPIRLPSITPFLTETHARIGGEVGVVSYAHDRAEMPSLQEVCAVLGREKDGVLVLSCSVDFGSSGAPIFSMDTGEPRIVSVVSAKAEMDSRPVALGTSLLHALDELRALIDGDDGVFHRSAPVVRRLSNGEERAGTGAKFVRP